MKIKSGPVLFLIGLPLACSFGWIVDGAMFAGEMTSIYSIYGITALIAHLLLKGKYESKKMTIVIPIVGSLVFHTALRFVVIGLNNF